MLQLLIKVIPLDLAATLSPGLLAIALVLLGSKFHPRARTFVFFLGTLLAGIIATVCGFALGWSAPDTPQSKIASLLDIVIGAIFIYFAFKALLSKPKEDKPHHDQESSKYLKLFIVSFILSITNFDAVLLNFAAAKEVSNASVEYFEKIITLVINLIFFTLPVLLPLLIYLIVPRAAAKILGYVNKFVIKYSKYLLFALFMVFGLYLVYRGLFL